MNKKERERNIFDMIFASVNATILETEEPDFIITTNENNHTFGVEITEFFIDDCYARVQNIPNYVERILNERRYCNKGDRKKLPVEKITILPSDSSSSKEIEGIITDVPSRDEYAKKLIERIEDKDSKIHNYNKNANSNYLIIFDNSLCLNSKTSSDLHETIFNLDLSKTIINSKFEEIFFITRVNNKLIYYRLKQVNFFALANLSLSFAKSSGQDGEDAFAFIISSLSSLGIELYASFSDEENHVELINTTDSVILKQANDKLKITGLRNIFATKNDINSILPLEEDINYFKTIEDDYNNFLKSKTVTFDLSYKISDDLDLIKYK